MKGKVLAFSLALFFPVSVSAGPMSEARPIGVGLVNILDFLLSIIGVVAIIGLVVAGLLYFFAAGDMRRIALAKKAMFAGIVGVFITLSGYIILRTIAGLL